MSFSKPITAHFAHYSSSPKHIGQQNNSASCAVSQQFIFSPPLFKAITSSVIDCPIKITTISLFEHELIMSTSTFFFGCR